ncbi:MAG: hypothetical protein VYE40_01530 [Myxococcota bacterium]|nr:hypothetical protein [Myxococcota bacterium]
MPIMELGPGPCEVTLNEDGRKTTIGFVWVTEDSPSHYESYYVLFSPASVPVALPTVGDSLTFTRIAEIGGHEITGPEEMADVVANTYPNETLNYQKIDESYDEWSP